MFTALLSGIYFRKYSEEELTNIGQHRQGLKNYIKYIGVPKFTYQVLHFFYDPDKETIAKPKLIICNHVANDVEELTNNFKRYLHPSNIEWTKKYGCLIETLNPNEHDNIIKFNENNREGELFSQNNATLIIGDFRINEMVFEDKYFRFLSSQERDWDSLKFEI